MEPASTSAPTRAHPAIGVAVVAVVFVARNSNSRSPSTTLAGLVITGEAVEAQVDSTTLMNWTPPPGDGDGLALGEGVGDGLAEGETLAEGLRLADPTKASLYITHTAAHATDAPSVQSAMSAVDPVTMRSMQPPVMYEVPFACLYISVKLLPETGTRVVLVVNHTEHDPTNTAPAADVWVAVEAVVPVPVPVLAVPSTRDAVMSAPLYS